MVRANWTKMVKEYLELSRRGKSFASLLYRILLPLPTETMMDIKSIPTFLVREK